MADATLTTSQKQFRNDIRSFATTHLKSARATYSAATTTTADKHGRFQSLQPIYQAAVERGLMKAQIPVPLGGTSAGLLDMALMVEELYAVDSSSSLTILGTGLGLTPLIFGGTPDMQTSFLAPFLSGQGTPLASLVFSEPQGSANFTDPIGTGLSTTATLSDDQEHYVLTGEKIWATNSSGWDDRGADLQCVACRIPSADSTATTTRDLRSEVALLLVTRADIASNPPSAYTVLAHPLTIGHTAVNGPHIRFDNLRVPRSNLLAPPDDSAARLIETTFTASAVLVAAMAVGIMRQAFAAALHFAKTEKRGSGEYLIEKQSVADILVQMKTRLEATRSLCRRAAVAFQDGAKLGRELCYEAKMFGSENAVECVREGIDLVGVSAYRRDEVGLGLGQLWEDVVVLPVFDGGNVGVRRRQVEGLLRGEGYDGLEE